MPRKEKDDKEKEIGKIIGSKIKEIRDKNNITQKMLADLLRVSQHVISAYENGSVGVSFYTVLRMCSIFKVSVDYFYPDENFMESTTSKSLNIDIDSYYFVSVVLPVNALDYRPKEEKIMNLLRGIYLGKEKKIIDFIHEIVKAIMIITGDKDKIPPDKNLKYEGYSVLSEYYKSYVDFIKSLYKDIKKNKKYIDVVEYIITKADIVDRTFIIETANKNLEEVKKTLQELLKVKS